MAARPRPLIDLGNGTHLVPLTQGRFAFIDSDDAAEVGKYCWRAEDRGWTWYALRSTGAGKEKRNVYLHRFLMGEPDGLFVDHRNCMGLDNRRQNLRLATASQNAQNARLSSRNTSGFKRVSLVHGTTDVWRADIRANGKHVVIGEFSSPEAAHAAYCEAAKRLHGEFARTA